jgi:hypothetical protein
MCQPRALLTIDRAISGRHVAQPTVNMQHWTVWCDTSLSDAPWDQWLTMVVLPNKEGNHTLFIVRWCTRLRPRIEGNQGLTNGTPTAPSCLGAIKGTPRHMEHYTKHPLNILQCRESANTHSFHCDIDLSTSLSCNSAVLFRVLFLVLCVCCCCNSRSCVCFYSPLLLCLFEIICVRRERLQIVEITHNGVLLR